MTRRRKRTHKISHFQSPTFGLCSAEFESANPESITKRALVMVEGHHVDSSKRKHFFGADRIHRIVSNTNNWIAQGGRVPWQRDHKKTQDANLGDLEGGLEARVITAEDLPDPRLRHLIGKVGAFAENLIGKGKEVVNDIIAGNIKTLSPGIDINADLIREISATPTPAIVGLSTFKRANFNGLTMEEVEAEGDAEDANKEAFEELGETFWTVVNRIYAASEDELQGQDPQSLLMQAVEDYSARITDLLGLGDAAMEPYAQPGQQGQPPYAPPGQYPQPAAPMPGYLQRQQGMSRMSAARTPIAAFTLADMENAYRAEFFGLPSFQQQKPKKQGSLLGTVAKGAALVAGGAAAIRYGGAGVKAGLRGGRTFGNMAAKATRSGKGFGSIGSTVNRIGNNSALGAGAGKAAAKGVAQAAGVSAYRGVRAKIGSDISRIGKALSRGGNPGGIRSSIGSTLQTAAKTVRGNFRPRGAV